MPTPASERCSWAATSAPGCPPPRRTQARLDSETLRAYGASVGAGVIAVLDAGTCPVSETSRVADFLATASAGQCGPCVDGLEAIASTVRQLASGTATRDANHDLERWLREVPGRGACQHPDRAIRFIDSALRVFSEEFGDHARRGPCPDCRRPAVLPIPRETGWSMG